MGVLIVVLSEQVDRRRDWHALRCTAPYDLSPQRDPSKSSHFHGHTCETCNIRQVCLAVFLFSIYAKPKPLYSENRATGVAFSFNPLFHPGGPTEKRNIRGTRLVVISAGSFGTPGILERSGIGSKDILEGVGVKQRVDLPTVGENYQGIMPRRL